MSTNPTTPPPLRPQTTTDIGQDAGMRMLIPVGRSVWAIIAGYFGLFAVLVVPAPIALILGIVAIIDIKNHPERHGMGRAVFAVIMGALFSALLAVVLLMMIFEG